MGSKQNGSTPSTWYVTNLRKIIADIINPESKCKRIMCCLMHMHMNY